MTEQTTKIESRETLTGYPELTIWDMDMTIILQGITTIQINKHTGNPDFRFSSISSLINQVEQNRLSNITVRRIL
ncbi:MAG TPA: hypothetical protein VFQ63_02955 [Patescibacteria group bacterium]|nr:hypothetical protein [Patescibacteria group bacterium]